MTYEQIFKEHLEFTSKTFPKGTARGAFVEGTMSRRSDYNEAQKMKKKRGKSQVRRAKSK